MNRLKDYYLPDIASISAAAVVNANFPEVLRQVRLRLFE